MLELLPQLVARRRCLVSWLWGGLLASLILGGCRPAAPVPPASPAADTARTPPTAPVAPAFRRLIEAETATGLTTPWEMAADPAAGKVAKIKLGAGKPPTVQGRMELKIGLPANQPAFLWFRVYWLGECSNSFDIQLPGQAALTVGQDGTYNVWHWVRLPGPAVQSQSPDPVMTIIQREDGVALDQVLITADSEYVPVGTED